MVARGPFWNYMMDKGRLQAVNHFAGCIATGAEPETASAEDGLRAGLISRAAIRSRDTGRAVAVQDPAPEQADHA